MSIQQKRERTLLVLVLAVFAAAVVNLSLFSFHVDLTSAGAWSISPATKAVISQAKAGISVTYYLSKKLTTYDPSTQGIVDFLDEYASASNGRVKVRVVDPQDTGQLNDMRSLGLQPYSMNIVEQSQQTQAVVYSGIVLQYLDKQEVLPLVGQIETLEYDLTTKVSKLVTQKQKTVAFLLADPTQTLQSNYSYLSQTLSRIATVRQVQPGEAIGDASVLVVAGSKGFTEAALKPVDDFLMKGGRVLFAVDGVFVDVSSAQAAPQLAGENPLLKALETWGVRVDQGMTHDIYVNTVTFNGPQGPSLYQYPLWPQIVPKDTSTTNPVTARFGGLSLLWPSPLTDLKKPGIKVEPLAWTSDKSWVTKENLSIDPEQAVQSRQLPGVKFEKQNEVLALTGAFPSTFPNGGTSPTTQILVIGSSAALSNLVQFLSNNGADANLSFVESAVDWLSQDEGLLSIKTRTYRDKSLTLLQDPSVRSAAAFALPFVNLFFIPAVIVVWAVVRMVRRRSREQKS